MNAPPTLYYRIATLCITAEFPGRDPFEVLNFVRAHMTGIALTPVDMKFEAIMRERIERAEKAKKVAA